MYLREAYSLMSKQEKDYTISVGDGDLKRIQYHSPICRKKIYYRRDKPVLTVREHLQEKYILADTGYKNSKMRYCESCGALIDVTKAYGGCPQCGSAIRVREAHKKIVTIDREIELLREGDFTYDSVLGTFFIPILISLHRSNARVNRVGYEMKKRDPQFSHTEFYGLILAQGEKLVKKRTTCTVRMKRREHVVTTHKADVLQCVKCGASLDMLGNGVCAYRGSRADISSIDWMLCGVQVNG